MKYLQPSFSVYPSVERKAVKREGRTTYAYCNKCAKVHAILEKCRTTPKAN